MTFHSFTTEDLLQFGGLITGIIGICVAIYTSVKSRQKELNSQIARMSVEREYYERSVRDLTDKLYKGQDRWQELNHLLIDSLQAQSSRPIDLRQVGELGPRDFFNSFGIQLDELTQNNKQVFVLTPFATSERSVYEKIASACREAGLHPKRGDEELIKGGILPHIVKEIAVSRLVIANINGRNPNVFYELGIAQAIGKPVIIISNNFSDAPFDLRQQQIVLYKSEDELLDKLRDSMVRLFSHPQ